MTTQQKKVRTGGSWIVKHYLDNAETYILKQPYPPTLFPFKPKWNFNQMPIFINNKIQLKLKCWKSYLKKQNSVEDSSILSIMFHIIYITYASIKSNV